jgi:hypothetical protein
MTSRCERLARTRQAVHARYCQGQWELEGLQEWLNTRVWSQIGLTILEVPDIVQDYVGALHRELIFLVTCPQQRISVNDI